MIEIYKITINNSESRLDGSVYYGQHRQGSFRGREYYGSGTPIVRYKKKYGIFGLQKEIISLVNTREEANLIECRVIGESFSKGEKSLNLRNIGEAHEVDAELRKRISEKLKGKIVSKETRAKLSEKAMGNKINGSSGFSVGRGLIYRSKTKSRYGSC